MIRRHYIDGMDLLGYAACWVDMVPHLDTLTRFASESRVVVEFGVRGGVSTWALLNGLPDDGVLIGVDPDPDVLAMAPASVLLDPRFRFVLGDDRAVPLPDRADMVMIDSSHEHKHTLQELDIAAAMQPARIVCHDYLFGDYCEGVRTAIDEWVVDGPYRLDHVEESRWGLAVLVPK